MNCRGTIGNKLDRLKERVKVTNKKNTKIVIRKLNEPWSKK